MDSATRPLETRGREERPKRLLARWLGPALVVAALGAFFALGLGRYLTFQSLAEHREWLLHWVQRLGLLAPLAFILIYAALIAVSIPVGAIVTLTGGFLFGTWLGGLYSLIAATLGSTAIFLIASTSFGALLRQRALPSLRKVRLPRRSSSSGCSRFRRDCPRHWPRCASSCRTPHRSG